MPQPTVGYGKFYYGGGLYGQMQIASGQISETATWSSTIKGELKAAGAMASSSVWTWSSTMVAHPIDAGRLSSTWTWSETVHGYLKAAGKNVTDTWHWTSVALGSLDVGTLFPQHWTWISAARPIVHAVGVVQDGWTWSTVVVGYNFWQPVAPDAPVTWTPQIPASDFWTPVVH